MDEKIPKKWVTLLIVLLLVAVGILAWRSLRQPESFPSLAAPLAEPVSKLKEKDRQVQKMEREISRLRRELEDRSAEVRDLNRRLDEASQALASVRQKVGKVKQEDEQKASPQPQPIAKEAPAPKEPETAGIWRRPAEPGTYETTRATPVFAEPSPSSRTLATMKQGTRVTVVGSQGDWLEVRSKHGNPPGFIRREDAMSVKGRD